MATPTARRYVEELETHREGSPVLKARWRVPQERLLVYEVKEGWGLLCEFLGVEEPDKPFPRLNDAAELRRMKVVVRILSVAIPSTLALAALATLAQLRTNLRRRR